jgi:hypothetical protein
VEARSTRNGLLAGAAALGFVAGLLLVDQEALTLSRFVGQEFFPTGFKVAEAFDILSGVLLASAFGVAFAGFVRAARRNALTIAALISAVGLEIYADSFPSQYFGDQQLTGMSQLARALAAMCGAVAFRRAPSAQGDGADLPVLPDPA